MMISGMSGSIRLTTPSAVRTRRSELEAAAVRQADVDEREVGELALERAQPDRGAVGDEHARSRRR